MRELILLGSAILLFGANSHAQCSAYFTSVATAEEVSFRNYSNVSHAHYYWNFGDGSSSGLSDPIHQFPGSGTYFVSLFALDTVNQCNSYSDQWITVYKKQPDSCQVAVADSFFTWGGSLHYQLIDASQHCHPVQYISVDFLGAANFPYGNWGSLDETDHVRYVNRARFGKFNSDSNKIIERYGYRSFAYGYSSAKNYGPCSANFEFNTVWEDSGGRMIRFSAMNKNAAEYQWYLTGFGNPILSNSDTVSWYYPDYEYYPEGILFSVWLLTKDANGCRDTLTQHVNSRRLITRSATVTTNIQVSVYPNPFSSEATLEFPLNNEQEASVRLYNNLGQLVQDIGHIQIGLVKIKRNSLASGLYYFQVSTSDNRIGSGKVIIR